MNQFFNNLQKEARNLKLSKDEKQAMRVHVYRVMETSPAYTDAQKNAVEVFAARRSTPSMYHWFSPRFSVPVAVLLLAGLSGGTAFAAQSALPGEPLYAVKIHVNEAVQTALATTPQAKAEVNASIATTRLEEAESLASAGTLDATTTAELADNFAQHADAAQAGTAAVAAEDPGTAAQLGATFSSTLAAHGAILAQLASDSATGTVQENSDALAVRVLAEAAHGEHSMHAQEGSTSPTATLAVVAAPTAIAPAADAESSSNGGASTTSPAVQVRIFGASRSEGGVAPASRVASSSDEGDAGSAAGTPTPTAYLSAPAANGEDGTISLALGTQASSTLTQGEADFAALAPSLDATTTAQIQSQISSLEQLLVQGNNALIAGDNATAQDAFSRVLRASVRLDAFLKAGKKFNPAFLTSLLK